MIEKKIHKVGLVGCGAISEAHINSILNNENFELTSFCDINENIVKNLSQKYKTQYYTDLEKMILSSDVNFVTIATPNNLHHNQAKFSLENGCDVLIEKPTAFLNKQVIELIELKNKHKRSAYCVLQVRKNLTVQLLKEVVEKKILGDIRGVNLVLRWNRPDNYFKGWKSKKEEYGGTLYQVGIHYLDVLQYVFGVPDVYATKIFKTKKNTPEIDDTIYSIFDFGSFGGTCEITISAEPSNLECSLSVLASEGSIKIGGKSLNELISFDFINSSNYQEFKLINEKYSKIICGNNYGDYSGSCPNHPYVYDNLNEFSIEESLNVISLIEKMYNY